MGEMINGWQIARDLGRYETKYTYRAAWTFFGVGGNLVEDAIYPLALVDSEGKQLNGANNYMLRFTKDQIPPVDAFWSLTMYDKDSYLVDNPIGRYAVGDRSNMKLGDDGSLTIYIQSESPGQEKEGNWLPSPKEVFKVALRLYVPKKQVADGSWKPPAVTESELAHRSGAYPGSPARITAENDSSTSCPFAASLIRDRRLRSSNDKAWLSPPALYA